MPIITCLQGNFNSALGLGCYQSRPKSRVTPL